MTHLPDLETFRRVSQGHQLAPVYRRLLSDALTPVAAFHQLDTGGHCCLFESVVGGERIGRYTFLTIDPFLQITARGTHVTVKSEQGEEQFECADPLDELRRDALQLLEFRVGERGLVLPLRGPGHGRHTVVAPHTLQVGLAISRAGHRPARRGCASGRRRLGHQGGRDQGERYENRGQVSHGA